MKRLTLYFLLLLSINLFSQQTEVIQDEGAKANIKISYKQNDKNNLLENKILSYIVKSKGGDINDLYLAYDVKEYRKITQYGSNVTLWLSVGNLVLQGDYSYKKFPINNLLIPSQISFASIWQSAEGKELDKSEFKKVPFKSGADLLKKKLQDNGNAKKSNLLLSNLELHFSQKDFMKFEAFIKSVDNYYDADARLNMLNKELDKIRTDTLELLDEYLQITDNNEKYFDQIKSLKLSSKLDLQIIDPISFKSHFGKTQVRNRDLKKQIEHTKKNMHEAYYKKGLDYIKWHNETKAKELFLKSIQQKNDYAQPYYQLAKIDFEHKKYDVVLDSCKSIMNTKKPNNDTRYNVLQLIDKVILIKIERIKELVEANYTDAAFEQLNNCKNYVQNVDGIRKYPEFDEISELIYIGVYNGLAQIAQKSIDEANLYQAEIDIDSLINFRQTGGKYYINPQKEENLLRELHNKLVEQGKNNLRLKQSEQALEYFLKAKKICVEYQFVACKPELTALLQQAYKESYNNLIKKTKEVLEDNLPDSAIVLLTNANKLQKSNNLEKHPDYDKLFLQAKQLKYNDLIAEGDLSLTGGDGQRALAYYEEAEDISSVIDLIKDGELPTKKRKAGAAYIMVICSQCETYVQALQLNKAQSGLNMCRALEQKYSLQDDEQVSEAINNLANLLNQGKCNEKQHEFNIQYGAANRFIENLDFENAKNSLQKAKQIAKSSKKCDIKTDKADSLSLEIQPISVYKQKLQEIDDLSAEKQYSSAIEVYQEAIEYYSESVKNNFGIKCDSLFYFIKKYENNELINYAVIYYTELGDGDKALQLLDELYGRDYIASWSKESQTTLGAFLANEDFEKDNEIDPKRNITQYTHDLFWYKFLKKSYLSHWKNLLAE